MSVRGRHRVRIALTIAAALVMVFGAVSVFWGVWVSRGDGAYRQYDASLVRATIYLYYSDRSASASMMSRMPQRGWRAHVDPAVGSPAIEWRPWFASQGPPVPSWALRVPLWIPLLALGAPTGWMWWRHIRRPRHVCEACGYDLRGTPGTTCPECGALSEGRA